MVRFTSNCPAVGVRPGSGASVMTAKVSSTAAQ